MLASPLPSTFLDTLSMSSLRCTASWIVINLLVLSSIYLSYPLVHFKNGLKYLTRGTAQMFISLMKFLQQNLVLRSFLVLLRCSFHIFIFIFVCFRRSLLIFPRICSFLFLPVFWCFFDWKVLFLSLFLLLFFIISRAIINSITIFSVDFKSFILLLWEFFAPALADGLSLEFEWL